MAWRKQLFSFFLSFQSFSHQDGGKSFLFPSTIPCSECKDGFPGFQDTQRETDMQIGVRTGPRWTTPTSSCTSAAQLRGKSQCHPLSLYTPALQPAWLFLRTGTETPGIMFLGCQKRLQDQKGMSENSVHLSHTHISRNIFESTHMVFKANSQPDFRWKENLEGNLTNFNNLDLKSTPSFLFVGLWLDP